MRLVHFGILNVNLCGTYFYHAYLQDLHFFSGKYCACVWCLRMSSIQQASWYIHWVFQALWYISAWIWPRMRQKLWGINGKISLLKFYIAEKQNWSSYFSHTSNLENMTIDLTDTMDSILLKPSRNFFFKWQNKWILNNLL